MDSGAHQHSVLHVLPHPGGGGETYVDALAPIDGYRFDRAYLAAGPDPAGARLAIVRSAVTIQRAARAYDVVHAHGEVASALCIAALAARPSVVTLHGLHLLRRLGGPAEAAARANLRLVTRFASRTICVSEAEYRVLRSVLGAATIRRAVVIANGVDGWVPDTAADRTAAKADFDLEPETVVGAWVGALDPRKDPLTPIAAIKEVARAGGTVALLVAGDGPLRAEVEQEAATGAAPVRVLGFRRDVRQVLLAADFFVVSSIREGLSFAVLEAMSAGLVPVVSDEPGNREAIGDAGIVVPFGDVAAYAEAFASLARDDRLRRSLGERARERVGRHFRADEMRRRTRAVYEEVLCGRAAG